MKLIVLISSYNEEKVLEKTIRSIPKFPSFDQQEVLVINDGSTDRTEEVAKKAGATVFNHKQNRGVGAGFQTGIIKALELGADIVVMIDSDGQFPVKDIPRLVKPILDEEADMVTASRFMRKQDIPRDISRTKLWGNRQIARIISFLIRQKYSDVACGFRAYSKEALLHLNIFGNFTYTQEVFIDLTMKGLQIAEIPVKVKYFKWRKKSRVYKGPFNYARRALVILIRAIRDYRPFEFFGVLGFSLFTLGLFADISLLIYYIGNQQFSPYISVGFLGAFLNILGIIFFIVGLVADMLGRMRMNQERLLYLLRRIIYSDR